MSNPRRAARTSARSPALKITPRHGDGVFPLRAAAGLTLGPPITAPASGSEAREGGQAASRRQRELKHYPTPGSNQRLVSTVPQQFSLSDNFSDLRFQEILGHISFALKKQMET